MMQTIGSVRCGDTADWAACGPGDVVGGAGWVGIAIAVVVLLAIAVVIVLLALFKLVRSSQQHASESS